MKCNLLLLVLEIISDEVVNLEPVFHTELLVDVVDVIFYSMKRDEKFLLYIFIAFSF